MAPPVDSQGAGHALEALFPEAPYEILAVTAEGRLFEESRHKPVIRSDYMLDHIFSSKKINVSLELIERKHLKNGKDKSWQ